MLRALRALCPFVGLALPDLRTLCTLAVMERDNCNTWGGEIFPAGNVVVAIACDNQVRLSPSLARIELDFDINVSSNQILRFRTR